MKIKKNKLYFHQGDYFNFNFISYKLHEWLISIRFLSVDIWDFKIYIYTLYIICIQMWRNFASELKPQALQTIILSKFEATTFSLHKRMFYCVIVVWNANHALQIMHRISFFPTPVILTKTEICKTFLPSISGACLRCYIAKGRPIYCIHLHPLFWHETFSFWHFFLPFLYFDFDLHPFQLLTCSMLVIVLVFCAE